MLYQPCKYDHDILCAFQEECKGCFLQVETEKLTEEEEEKIEEATMERDTD